jgi:hypothetical protein
LARDERADELAACLGLRGQHVWARVEPHELVGAAQEPLGILEPHEVDEHPPARALEEGERRLLHHAGLDLAARELLIEVGAERDELDAGRVDALPLEEVLRHQVVGGAEVADPDPVAREVADRLDLGGAGAGHQREERQPRGRGDHHGLLALGHRLDDEVDGRAGPVDAASEERVDRLGAATHVDEVHVEPLGREEALLARDLEGEDAEHLAAEGQLNALEGAARRGDARGPPGRGPAGARRGRGALGGRFRYTGGERREHGELGGGSKQGPPRHALEPAPWRHRKRRDERVQLVSAAHSVDGLEERGVGHGPGLRPAAAQLGRDSTKLVNIGPQMLPGDATWTQLARHGRQSAARPPHGSARARGSGS